jgi:hypothetical protein
VSPTELRASLLLPGCSVATCTHAISVQNAAGTATAALPFLVQADPPAVTTFSTDPAPPYQGDPSVLLTFGGTSLPTGSTIQVQPPGGAFGDVPVTEGAPSADPSRSVTGTISLAGRPDGSFGGGGLSAAFPFRVLSNQAILRDMLSDPDPDRSGPQGSVKTTVTLQATSLRPPYSEVRVLVRGPGIPAASPLVLDPADPAAATADLVISSFSLAGRETGNYAFTVRNPGGAAESNALTFVVTPGAPTVTSVCRLEGSACATANPTSVAQQAAPVPVRITGTNFAKPDASGNGSAVMVAASFMAGWPTACPAPGAFVPFQPVPGTVQVVSATQIDVQLDTLSALPGNTYYVAVWNGAQRSSGCGDLPGSLPGFTVTP